MTWLSPALTWHITNDQPTLSLYRSIVGQTIWCKGRSLSFSEISGGDFRPPNQPKANNQRIIGSADISYILLVFTCNCHWTSKELVLLLTLSNTNGRASRIRIHCVVVPVYNGQPMTTSEMCFEVSDVHIAQGHSCNAPPQLHNHPWPALPSPLEKRLCTRPPGAKHEP